MVADGAVIGRSELALRKFVEALLDRFPQPFGSLPATRFARGRRGGSDVIASRQCVAFGHVIVRSARRGAGTVGGGLAAGAAVPGIVRRRLQARLSLEGPRRAKLARVGEGVFSFAGAHPWMSRSRLAAVDRGIEQFRQRRSDRLHVGAVRFRFRGFARLFGRVRILRHQPNMGRVRCGEKGKSCCIVQQRGRRATVPSSMAGHSRSKNGVAYARLCPAIHASIRDDQSKSRMAGQAWSNQRMTVFARLPCSDPCNHPKYVQFNRHILQANAFRGITWPKFIRSPANPSDPSMLANIPRLVTAYFAGKPDPQVAAQRVAFGTSGHRGSALNNAFNEAHILAISQALCDHRRAERICPDRCSSASTPTRWRSRRWRARSKCSPPTASR